MKTATPTHMPQNMPTTKGKPVCRVSGGVVEHAYKVPAGPNDFAVTTLIGTRPPLPHTYQEHLL